MSRTACDPGLDDERVAKILPWRGTKPAYLPHFSEELALRRIVDGVTADLHDHIWRLLPHVVRHARIDEVVGVGELDEEAVYVALLTCRYGATYCGTPMATAPHVTWAERHSRVINALGVWLTGTNWHNRVLNAAITSYLLSPIFTHLIGGRFAPRRGFHVQDGRTLTRRVSGILESPEAALRNDRAHYDFHDFAHLVAATLCNELFGVKHYCSSFEQLPPDLIDLVAGYDSHRSLPRADGSIFSRFLHDAFFSLDLARTDEDTAAARLEEELVAYLMGGTSRSLSERHVQAYRGMFNPYELAMVAQNQAYESPASEVEVALFVRGGVDGLDDLDELTPVQRLFGIAALDDRTYHERRNIAKRRAQRSAYATVAGRLLESGNLSVVEEEVAVRTLHTLQFVHEHGAPAPHLYDYLARALIP